MHILTDEKFSFAWSSDFCFSKIINRFLFLIRKWKIASGSKKLSKRRKDIITFINACISCLVWQLYLNHILNQFSQIPAKQLAEEKKVKKYIYRLFFKAILQKLREGCNSSPLVCSSRKKSVHPLASLPSPLPVLLHTFFRDPSTSELPITFHTCRGSMHWILARTTHSEFPITCYSKSMDISQNHTFLAPFGFHMTHHTPCLPPKILH